MFFEEKIKEYPIYQYSEKICEELKKSKSRCMVLSAQTGAGKSTILPLFFLKNFKGKIIMTQPRRLAVLSVSERISSLWNQDEIGYKVHLENNTNKNTRLTVETEAILIRELQNSQDLEGINLVILDEFHERSKSIDLALAFLKEAMQLRDDLYVVIMSATIDQEKICRYFGGKGNCAFMNIEGRSFPIEIKYEPELCVSQAVIKEAKVCPGNILVFLPGISEIKKCYEELQKSDCSDYDLYMLHSSIRLEDQKEVLKKSERKKIIISSAIAETSLTINGIKTVIDSGLTRINRINVETGIENLVTETESEFSAVQRMGRAGRESSGKCIRLWSENEKRIRDIPAQICCSEISDVVLECADRGIYDLENLDLLDKPTIKSWKKTQEFLQIIDCLDDKKRITQKGKNCLKLGTGIRLASIALSGKDNYVFDLILKYSSYSRSDEKTRQKFIQDLKKRISNIKTEEKNIPNEMLILEGFPDRIAKRVNNTSDLQKEYQFVSGKKAILHQDIKANPVWIAAPQVIGGEKGKNAVIYDFEELPENLIENWLLEKSKKEIVCKFENDKIQKFENQVYGKLILKSKKLETTDHDYCLAWENKIQEEGIFALPLSEKSKNLILRKQFMETYDVEEKIVEQIDNWLPSFLGNNRKLTEEIVYEGLYWFLEGSELDKKVPQILILPNGVKAKVKYEYVSKENFEIRPSIEIIIQRIFGCFEIPKICGKKVLLKLLSPASRPLQVTDDLEHFWNGAWIEICKEMKGRYPKHNWDYRLLKDE